jgi:hypothetical protein
MVIFRIFSSGGKFRLNFMKNLRGFGNLRGLAIMKNLRGFGNLGGLALNIIKRIGCGTRFVTPSDKKMVEVAGQFTHCFHNGLDYSFIWTVPEESVYGKIEVVNVIINSQFTIHNSQLNPILVVRRERA